MELVVIILTIFLVIALGGIVFLLKHNKNAINTDSLSNDLQQKLANSIDDIFKRREDDFKKSSKENRAMEPTINSTGRSE